MANIIIACVKDIVSGRGVNDLQVCVTAVRKTSHLLIVVGLVQFIHEKNSLFIERSG